MHCKYTHKKNTVIQSKTKNMCVCTHLFRVISAVDRFRQIKITSQSPRWVCPANLQVRILEQILSREELTIVSNLK